MALRVRVRTNKNGKLDISYLTIYLQYSSVPGIGYWHLCALRVTSHITSSDVWGWSPGHNCRAAAHVGRVLPVAGQTSFQVCYVCDEQRGQGQGE